MNQSPALSSFRQRKNMTAFKDQVYPLERRRGPEQIMSLYVSVG